MISGRSRSDAAHALQEIILKNRLSNYVGNVLLDIMLNLISQMEEDWVVIRIQGIAHSQMLLKVKVFE